MGSYISNFDTTAQFAAFSATTDFKKPHVVLTKSDRQIRFIDDPCNIHEYVEIGGVKWATKNIGACTEVDNGLYFQWGDTQGYAASEVGSGTGKKYFGWADYKYSNNGGSRASDMTKYNSTDHLVTLEASDDAAIANWGSEWRMPTTEEFAELSAAIDFIDSGGTTISDTNKLTTLSGVTGILVADKNDHSKRLFFPAAGYCNRGSVYSVGSRGRYWSSSLGTSSVIYGRRLYFNSGGVDWQDSDYRYNGFAVRPVLA